jgi:hypothetical protein
MSGAYTTLVEQTAMEVCRKGIEEREHRLVGQEIGIQQREADIQQRETDIQQREVDVQKLGDQHMHQLSDMKEKCHGIDAQLQGEQVLRANIDSLTDTLSEEVQGRVAEKLLTAAAVESCKKLTKRLVVAEATSSEVMGQCNQLTSDLSAAQTMHNERERLYETNTTSHKTEYNKMKELVVDLTARLKSAQLKSSSFENQSRMYTGYPRVESNLSHTSDLETQLISKVLNELLKTPGNTCT